MNAVGTANSPRKDQIATEEAAAVGSYIGWQPFQLYQNSSFLARLSGMMEASI